MVLADVFISLLQPDLQQDLKKVILIVSMYFMLYQLQALSKEEQFSLTPATVVSIRIFTYIFHTMNNTIPFWLNLTAFDKKSRRIQPLSLNKAINGDTISSLDVLQVSWFNQVLIPGKMYQAALPQSSSCYIPHQKKEKRSCQRKYLSVTIRSFFFLMLV